jgi:hypothetical protein
MDTSSKLRELQMAADSFGIELSRESWFELMHWHPDTFGVGNVNQETREACLLLAKQYLTSAMNSLRKWSKPSQCWLLLDPFDSSQDAIYVHTENPNRLNFPYKFEDITWGVAGPQWILPAFPSSEYMVGINKVESLEPLCWIIERKPHPLVNANLVH